MKKYLFIVGFLLFITILHIQSNSPAPIIAIINKEYTGYVSDIYYDRYLFVQISNLNTHAYENDMGFTSDFLCAIELGDSIHKIPHENSVRIFKENGSVVKTSYIYIPNSMRNDFRWPKEWKDKWMNSSMNHDPCDVASLYSKFGKR